MNVRRWIGNGFAGTWGLRANAAALLAGLWLLPGCGNSGAGGEPDGSVRGELRSYRIDYLDGHSEHQYFLAAEPANGAQTRLVFASDPELQPWTKLKVWGSQANGAITVERYQELTDAVTSDVAETSEALTNPTKKTRTVGFVMMDVGDGVNISAADANTAIFGVRAPTQAGLNQFYNENSYGGFNFTGDILGPKTVTTLGTCQQDAITMIENGWPTVFNKTYDHWMQYIGSTYSSCGWAGIGGEGTAGKPAYGSWYNASAGCTVINQEVGHNLGLMHSNSLTCTGASFADDPQTCAGAEYGDRHTVMGSGCAHLGAYEKWYEGFFGGCNAVRATASGMYTLLPTESPCGGVQALQIPMPKTRPFHNTTGTATVVNLSKYYLELRTKVGIDANEPAPAVLVTVSGEVPAASKTSEFTWVLDMDPTTTKTAEGLTAGKSFTDPAGGVSFSVQDIDATHATVKVTIDVSSGPATCADGTAFTQPGPQSCGTVAAGGSGGISGAGGASSSGAGGTAGAATSNGGASGNHNGGAAGVAGASFGSGGGGTGGVAGSAAVAGGAAGASGTAGSAGVTGVAGAPAASGGAGGASSGTAGALNGLAGLAGVPSSTNTPAAGCSCRQAPAVPSRTGPVLGALLLLGLLLRRRRSLRGSTRKGQLSLASALAAALLGCSSGSDPNPGASDSLGSAGAETADCASRAEGVSLGLSKVTSAGYTFTLDSMQPAEPVQSEGAPGNTWTVSLTDSNGEAVTGAVLQVSSYMPDHGHYAPTAVAAEQAGGTYRIDDLVLPMPGLYEITLSATLPDDTKQGVSLSLCMMNQSG